MRRLHVWLVVSVTGCIIAGLVPLLLTYAELNLLQQQAQQLHATNALATQAREAAHHVTKAMEAAGGEGAQAAFSQAEGALADLGNALTARVGEGRLPELGLAALAVSEAAVSLAAPIDPADLTRARSEASALIARADLHVSDAERELRTATDESVRKLFDRFGSIAILLLSTIGVGCTIAAVGSISIFRSLQRAAQSKAALQEAESILRQRTLQLTEAHRLGKLGEYRFSSDMKTVELGPEAQALLRLPSSQASLRVEAFSAMFMDARSARMASLRQQPGGAGATNTIDVQMRRGDGSIGDFSLTTKPISGPDGSFAGIFGTLQDISDRKAAESQLEQIAYCDPLTGLANRSRFNKELAQSLSRIDIEGGDCALMLIDIDRFKEVNDTLGHGAGDELLIKIGVLLWRMTTGKGFLARLGGDEYAIIFSGNTDRAFLSACAERITKALSASFTLERGEVDVGASIGISRAPADGRTASDLLRNADLALYKAKENGRGGYAFFTADLDLAAQTKATLAKELRHALAHSSAGLHLHYQPQVEIATGLVTGFEALIRWTHPQRGEISPAEFIPIAESTNLISDVGNWVLRQAARQAKAWIDAGAPPREVSVNVSAAQLCCADFVAEVASVLRETMLPAHLLCLELTESVMVDYAEGRVRTAMKALKGLGVTLALDDFGTSYSSLGHLAELPLDKLKIDRVFVHGSVTSHRAHALLKGIIALGRRLGMTVIAEGAETAAEVALLRDAECDMVQGFVFGPALPPVEARRIADRSDEVPLVEPTTPSPAFMPAFMEEQIRELRAVG